MVLRRGTGIEFLPRSVLIGVLAGFLALFAAFPAGAALLPGGFFDAPFTGTPGAAAVEADRLSYDGRRNVISAEGGVILAYQGYVIHADRLEFNQGTGELHAIGNVRLEDPTGNVYEADSIEVTGGLKEAFINSLTITTAEGALVTARDATYSSELQTILTDAAYSPCGLCIDSKGRKIGWKVKAARLIYDRDKASVILEQPSLELLGIPVAWLPWFWIPDPSQPRATGLRMPSVDYDPELGVSLTVPYFVPAGEDIDIIFSPELLSRQGLLLRADATWRVGDIGAIDVSASGIYQLDPGAFAGLPGNIPWRGAIQTSGKFTLTPEWTAGWSYSTFTDNAYLTDYKLSDADSAINQAYTTYLGGQSWADLRIQRFNRLGNYFPADDAQQGMAIPNGQFDHVHDLEQGWGRLHISGQLLGVHRDADQTDITAYGGLTVPYVFGYAGDTVHAEVEGAWENQIILPGGLAATPYLGIRLDAAWYDGYTAALPAPYPTVPDATLFSATPIAALDLRYPLVAFAGGGTHLVEPIAQIVYRGSSTTDVGIVNNDSQSFVFDTANLFDYNRFSGIDRQETGLRANIGGHYLGNFDDGSWLDLMAGESFQLLGPNAFSVTDPTQMGGTSTGLAGTASYIVASARGGWANGLSAGAKVQVDPATPRITRAGVGVAYANAYRFSAGADYICIAADPTLGNLTDQHEITPYVGIPIDDYWGVNGGITYDIAAMNWVGAYTGVTYDDGYLTFGATGSATPTSWGFGVSFGLKGPDGQVAF